VVDLLVDVQADDNLFPGIDPALYYWFKVGPEVGSWVLAMLSAWLFCAKYLQCCCMTERCPLLDLLGQ